MIRFFKGRRLRLLVGLGFMGIAIAMFLVVFNETGIRVPGLPNDEFDAVVVLQDADNMVLNDQVQIAGIQVGAVRSVERLDQGGARVLFSVNDEVAPLHEGVTIRIGSRSLVEETFLDIKDGKGPPLPNGSTIPPSQVTPNVQVHDVLRSLDEKTRSDMGQFLRALGPATQGTQPDTAALAEGLGNLGREGNTALDAIAAQSQDLRALSAQLPVVLRALDTGEGRIANLVTDADRLTGATSRRQGAVADTFRQLPGVLQSATTSADGLHQLSGALAPVASDLKEAAPFLRTALKELPDTTKDLRGLLPPLSGTLDRAPATLERVPPFDEELREVIDPARDMLADLNPALRFISPYGLDFAGFFVNFNSVLQYTDEKGQHHLRLAPIVNSNSLQTPFKTPQTPGNYFNPYPKPGAGPHPGPFTGAYPRVERAPR